MTWERTKLAIVAQATELAKRTAETVGVDLRGACLLYAGAVVAVARTRGVVATHFSYEFDPATANDRIARKLLPEMHCWAGDLARNEIVDLSTKHLVAQARALAGLAWTAARPPEFLWGEPPEHVSYEPVAAATWLAEAYLFHLMRDYGTLARGLGAVVR